MAAAEAEAAATLERLEALSCPPILGGPPLSPPEALALLCRPSGPRRALLRWLCARIHPPLRAHLESLAEDAEMREVAKLGAELMLCGAEDLALVQGTAPPRAAAPVPAGPAGRGPPPGDPPQNQLGPAAAGAAGDPRGGGGAETPHPPPVDEELSGTPPKSRRPLPELEEELGRVRRGLEQLQDKAWNSGVSPGPSSPNLGVSGGSVNLGFLGGSLASLAAAFRLWELRDPPGPPGTPPQIQPRGGHAPNVGRGLRGLRQVLGSLAQLGVSAGSVAELGGVSEAIEPQISPLARRFQPPPD